MYEYIPTKDSSLKFNLFTMSETEIAKNVPASLYPENNKLCIAKALNRCNTVAWKIRRPN